MRPGKRKISPPKKSDVQRPLLVKLKVHAPCSPAMPACHEDLNSEAPPPAPPSELLPASAYSSTKHHLGTCHHVLAFCGTIAVPLRASIRFSGLPTPSFVPEYLPT